MTPPSTRKPRKSRAAAPKLKRQNPPPTNDALDAPARNADDPRTPPAHRPDLVTMAAKIEEAKKLGLIKPGGGPYQAIMALLDFYSADWMYWVGRYNAMPEDEIEREDKNTAWIRRQVYAASNRLQKLAKETAALGIEEKKVHLEQARVLMIVQALEAAMSVAGVEEAQQMKIIGHMARQLGLPTPELPAVRPSHSEPEVLDGVAA